MSPSHTARSVLAALAVTLAAGCGLGLPNAEPPWAEKQRQLEADAEATYNAEMIARNKVREEIAPYKPAFLALVREARAAVPKCPEVYMHNPAPRTKSKLVIWDLTTDDFADAHPRLPPDLRATDPDGRVAVFLITKKDRSPLNTYFSSYWSAGQGGGKRAVTFNPTICLVEMPGAKPVARVTKYGQRPNNEDARRQWDTADEIVGDWQETVKEWAVESARGPKPKPKPAD